MRIRTNTTAESYANRFSIKPEYSYSKGVWTFKWGKDKPKTNTFGTITIKAKDRGPGIPDIEWACRDGTSTANDWIRSMGFGAGMGLSNSKRVSDEFDIQSEVGKFTKVTCLFRLSPTGPEA